MQKNVIVCLLVGDKYDPLYVRNLFNMTKRWCSASFDFVCYTDVPLSGIDCIKIDDPNKYEPVWFKLEILSLKELSTYTHKAFFDLDVVIHNNIDWIFEGSRDPNLHVIQSKWKHPEEINSFRNTGCNSSVMLWQQASDIFNQFNASPDLYMSKYTGMDRFLWHETKAWSFLKEEQVYSYSGGASLEDNTPHIMRANRSVCIYNQYPKPHEQLGLEPARTFWK
jgi:hypothetical protein